VNDFQIWAFCFSTFGGLAFEIREAIATRFQPR